MVIVVNADEIEKKRKAILARVLLTVLFFRKDPRHKYVATR